MSLQDARMSSLADKIEARAEVVAESKKVKKTKKILGAVKPTKKKK